MLVTMQHDHERLPTVADEQLPTWRAVLRSTLQPIVLSGACLLGLALNYLWFHTLAELASIVIAFTAMVVATSSRRFTRNHFVVYISIALGWCAALDAIHMLVFKGMHILEAENTNLAPQFWVAARFLQAVALVTATCFLKRIARPFYVHATFGFAAGAAALAIATGHFPDAYIDGQGLTAFKIFAEYAIIILLVATLVLLWRNRALMSPTVRSSLITSVVAMIVSEFLFTQYVSVHATSNLYGHIAKIFAFWFIFAALVQSTLREPFGMLARAASTYDAVPDPTIIVMASGVIRQANAAAARYAGVPAEELAGSDSHVLFHDDATPPDRCPVCSRLRDMSGTFVADIDRASDPSTVECTVAPFAREGPAAFVQVIRDISARKQHEAEVLHQARRVEALLTLPAAAERMGEAEFLKYGMGLAESLTESRVSFTHVTGDVAPAGIWTDVLREQRCVVANDRADTPGMRATADVPDDLARLVSVPVVEGGKVCMLAAVGNKQRDYTDRDAETVLLIAHEIWRIASRRRTEKRLVESEANLRTLVHAIPDVVWMKSAEGRVLLCNPPFERLFGVKEAAVLGKTDYDLFDRKTADLFTQHDRLAMHAGKPIVNEEWVTSSGDGSRALFETVKTPVRSSDGNLLGVLGVARDITERQRIEVQQKQLVRDLGERVKELRCLYELSRVLEERGADETRILSETVAILPAAFQNPERMRASIASDWGDFGNPDDDLPGPVIERALRIGAKRVGHLRVLISGSAPVGHDPFLPEESQLLDTVAARLSDALERMQSAARVRRLSYLYAMLSATNRTIVRAKGRDELFASIFEALLSSNAFPTLFIATTDTQGPPLRVAHCHGVDAGHRHLLDELLSDEPVHPFGEVLATCRAGKVMTGTLPDVGHPGTWAGYLREQGLRRWAAMPLRCEGILIGLIGLHAEAMAGFDEEEFHLLGEMADDVTFALTGLVSEERRKTAEQRADVSEGRFHDVFDASPVPMQIISINSDEMRAFNQALVTWLGYSRNDISTKDAWFASAYPDPDYRARMRANWASAIEAARVSRSAVRSPEITLVAKDGSRKVALGIMTVLDDDAIIAWNDLTVIRHGEAALHDSDRRFRGMIEQTFTGIFVSCDGRIAYANPRACEILGRSVDEMLGRDILDLAVSDPQGRRGIEAARATLKAGGHNASVTIPALRKDGTPIELGLHATSASWDGNPAFIVMMQDVTERTRAEHRIADYVKQLEESMRTTLRAISNMVELRDPYTAGHERRVGLIAAAIAGEMGWDEKRCATLDAIGLVHDIGKIAVPAEILAKPTRLTDLEMEIVRGHSAAGYQILKDVQFAFPVAETILQHHERMDGSGYPRGLRGDAIIPEARILAVADVVESMSSHRPYRPSLGIDKALAEIERGRDTVYDREAADALIRLVRDKGYVFPD